MEFIFVSVAILLLIIGLSILWAEYTIAKEDEAKANWQKERTKLIKHIKVDKLYLVGSRQYDTLKNKRRKLQ